MSEEKKTLRKKMLLRREAMLSSERREADVLIRELVLKNKKMEQAKWVLSYVSYQSEAATDGIITELLADGKKVAVPKIVGKEMLFFEIHSLSELATGFHGIMEPVSTDSLDLSSLPAEKTVVLVPGCAFDRRGNRLGYGGGYYDRFFQSYPLFYRLALSYEGQLLPSVIAEERDIPVREIITERRSWLTVPELLFRSEKAQRAMEAFLEGYNCAQALTHAFSDETGLEPELLARLSAPFGAGMGRLREVCGAVSGMQLVAGILFGYADPKAKEEKAEHYRLVQKLAGEFRSYYGSIVCRELLGLTEKVSSPEPEERTEAYYKKRPCKEQIGLAAAILENYLRERKEPDGFLPL